MDNNKVIKSKIKIIISWLKDQLNKFFKELNKIIL